MIVRRKSHFAVKFAAGAMRVVAILVALAGLLAVAGAALAIPTQLQTPAGTAPIPGASTGGAAGALGLVFLVFALAYATILWGLADGLILLADTYDAQRTTQLQVNDLITGERTPTVTTRRNE